MFGEGGGVQKQEGAAGSGERLRTSQTDCADRDDLKAGAPQVSWERAAVRRPQAAGDREKGVRRRPVTAKPRGNQDQAGWRAGGG